MAHGANVNCLALSPSSGHMLATGGIDRKVNLWVVGKPNNILVSILFHIITTASDRRLCPSVEHNWDNISCAQCGVQLQRKLGWSWLQVWSDQGV